jgi:hypothetical protein
MRTFSSYSLHFNVLVQCPTSEEMWSVLFTVLSSEPVFPGNDNVYAVQPDIETSIEHISP